MNSNNDPRDEKLQAGEIVIDNPVLKKADNFWFYNKWKIIITAFAVIVLGVCIWQSCTKENYDATLMYAGPYDEINTKENFIAVQNALNAAIPEDIDGNGEKSCDIVTLIIYSNDQIEEMKKTAASESKKIYVNAEMNNQELQKFDQLILAGEYSVCLLDPTLYERVKAPAASAGSTKCSAARPIAQTMNIRYALPTPSLQNTSAFSANFRPILFSACALRAISAAKRLMPNTTRR